MEKRGRGTKGKVRKPKLDPQVEEDLIAKRQRLEMELEYFKKLSALVSAREQKEIALVVRELSAKYPLTELLKLSGIPRSTYYYFQSQKERDYSFDMEMIRKVFEENKGRYG